MSREYDDNDAGRSDRRRRESRSRSRSRGRSRSGSRSSRAPKEEVRSLFIRGLSDTTRSQDLLEAFQTYGTVTDCYLPRDYYTGKPRGFAYIQYATQEEADRAFSKIEYITINGRTVTIEWAAGRRKTPIEMRGRGPRPSRYRPRGGYGSWLYLQISRMFTVYLTMPSNPAGLLPHGVGEGLDRDRLHAPIAAETHDRARGLAHDLLEGATETRTAAITNGMDTVKLPKTAGTTFLAHDRDQEHAQPAVWRPYVAVA
ncbi:hypothetical protein SpCBS45565_g03651 [Spizellomyces sp. 'palustris']|nr:hypothetical protein SpCBS45565_g03651 [Spizellomyces sp. 'palustris']